MILADLGVVERRLERLERDLKKGQSTDLRKEQEILVHCRSALEEGRALRALDLSADDAKRLRGFQFLSAKPLLIVLNLDEEDLSRADTPFDWPASRRFSRAPPPAPFQSAQKSNSRSLSSNPRMPPRSWPTLGCASRDSIA